MKLNETNLTRIAISVAAVSFWVNTDHVGNIMAFNICSIEHLLAEIVKFVGEDASLDPDSIIGLLTNKPICHFGEPPYSFIYEYLPLRYHLFLTANKERLI
jgi:hypothetical protein